jgi:uroporphyrinogen-III decarboxylase
VFRTEQDRTALRLVYERFGHAGVGEKDPRPRPHLEICGHRMISALFGCEIFYQDDQAPACRHLPVGSPAEIAAIPKPDIETNRWAVEFRKQGAVLSQKYGTVDATINNGGPINAASTILGSEALLYLTEAPEVMTAFLKTVADVCVEAYDRLTAPLNPEIAGAREMFIGNCPVMMMSPSTYRKTVLPADLHFRARVPKFGLHHCGKMDRYLSDYKQLEPMEYIEVGWGSDIGLVRKAFPRTTLDLMINIYDLQSMAAAQIHDVVERMLLQAAPLSCVRDFFVADIGPEVPDAKVLEFIEAVDTAVAHTA